MPGSTVQTLRLDPAQLSELIAGISRDANGFSGSDVISLASAMVAILALAFAYSTYAAQRRDAQRRYVADLHSAWWTDEFDAKRHLVWAEVEDWREHGEDSAAVRYYSGRETDWTNASPVVRAHARVLFFFSDLNRLLRHGMVDESLAFEMFGVSQYEWFRPYFTALRAASVAKERGSAPLPRWVPETIEFEKRLDRWKASGAGANRFRGV